jgi:peptidoglycan/LPS O-acetylase OafA/YrhL
VGYLRILLALSVAVGHLPAGMYGYERAESTIIFVGAIVAVKLFFIISGFYMAMIFNKHYSGDASRFFVSRAIRLFPAYWLTMIFCVAAVAWFKRPDIAPGLNFDFWYFIRDPVAIFLVALSNLTFAGIDFGQFICFAPAATLQMSVAWTFPCPAGQMLLLSGSTLVQPAWTLSLEWYFYLLVPLFCAMSMRQVARVAGCSFLLATLLAVFASIDPWQRAFFPAELYLFLLGFLAYRLKDLIPRAVGGTCAALVMVAILAYQHIPVFDWKNPAGANFALYFGFALALPTLFEMGSHLPAERLAGDLSYPIYICHLPIEAVIQAILLHERMSLFTWIATNVLIIVIASTLLLAATAPAEKFRLRFKTMRSHGPRSVQLA